MFARRSLVVCGAAAVGTLLVVACTTDYQKGLDDPKYGSPNALVGQRQPGSTTDHIAPSAGGAEGGAPTTAPKIECVAQGGALLDAGACAVSFKNDVLPALGRSTCAMATCHGGATPPTPPRIEPGDPGAMWAEFAAFKMNTGGLPYINPCSTDKTKAGIACNLYATGSCGVKMPLGGNPQTPQEDIDKIDQWLECGSPDN
jgi:hypothetical protein